MIIFESMPVSIGGEVIIGRSDDHLGQYTGLKIALRVNKATGKTVIVSDGDSNISVAQNGALIGDEE